jgi:leucyl-tRNA synthetase
MSKSKKNVVDPNIIVEQYGADATRLFILSDSPPERDGEWTEAGVEGSWRYVNRLWRLINNAAAAAKTAPASSDSDQELREALHRAIAGVADDIDKFRFNAAVARIRTLSNVLEDHVGKASAGALTEAVTALIKLINPIMPHLAEELWQHLGHTTMLTEELWPIVDETLLVSTTVTMAVQVNGKLRGTITMNRDTPSDVVEQEALADEAVQRYLDGKPPRKVIVVANRIVNIVV